MLALILAALIILAGVNTIRVLGEPTAAKRMEGATLAALSLAAFLILSNLV